MNNIVIELSQEDALLFRKFREYQNVFSVMVDSGIFETPNCQAILNFNGACLLTQIDKNVLAYKRVAPRVGIIIKS